MGANLKKNKNKTTGTNNEKMPVYTTFSKGIIFCPTYFESLVAKLLEIIYCYDFDAL